MEKRSEVILRRKDPHRKGKVQWLQRNRRNGGRDGDGGLGFGSDGKVSRSAIKQIRVSELKNAQSIDGTFKSDHASCLSTETPGCGHTRTKIRIGNWPRNCSDTLRSIARDRIMIRECIKEAAKPPKREAAPLGGFVCPQAIGIQSAARLEPDQIEIAVLNEKEDCCVLDFSPREDRAAEDRVERSHARCLFAQPSREPSWPIFIG
ncbi:hypothetical protein B0H17DRAFT_1230386 [Mycena rosella]|uniref:Uncharacterized protein n=1 Tax=Mycena rosella TaxID=1033263 RepID=A0AAD7D6C5_MYCRO|nr:hypothetical protein B0H17DRAFT_1230386 [Mycena rosella]